MSIASPIETGQSVVLYDVSWQQYEGLLEAFGNRRLRHSYDRGTLQILSPTTAHE